jgi:hypothetical protein
MTRFILVVVLCFHFPTANARFAHFETAPVPVDRVLTNLTKRLEGKTNDFELLHVLARLHSLSYARAASNWLVKVYTNATPTTFSPQSETEFNLDLTRPGFPPENVTPGKTLEQNAAAKAHLAKAIDFYQRAAAVNPSREIVQIGLGWCQVQAGDTNAAKKTLRRAVKTAWANEKTSGHTTWSTTAEAIGYLRPLLDRKADKKELDDLTRIAERAHKLQRYVTPIVIPLQPNLTPTDLINTNASVTFDLDGSADPNRCWQWINTNAAWIVHLPQGGPVTSALQMFGNVTFWMFWENGYHALASLDDNADGLLTGEELSGIRLWHDQNSDAKSTPNEILELRQLGITALDTRYTTKTKSQSPQPARVSRTNPHAQPLTSFSDEVPEMISSSHSTLDIKSRIRILNANCA